MEKVSHNHSVQLQAISSGIRKPYCPATFMAVFTKIRSTGFSRLPRNWKTNPLTVASSISGRDAINTA
jgi:hypothetical protein